MASRPELSIVRRRLRRGPSVSAGAFVLTPVVLESSGAGTTANGCWLVAAKRPVAIIVKGESGRRLVRLVDDAQPIPD